MPHNVVESKITIIFSKTGTNFKLHNELNICSFLGLLYVGYINNYIK
jgi:hypothetical protein